MKIVTWDDKFGLVKVNPLATWSDDDVAYYLASNALPEHPLWAQGYASIGCAAVTGEARGARGPSIGPLGRRRQGGVRAPRGLTSTKNPWYRLYI